ncbi:hypothetical protein [Bradyrhizobium sp. USDA 4454]
MSDDTLAEADKPELLANAKYLSEMAAKNEERNPSVLKSVLRSISCGSACQNGKRCAAEAP